MPAEPKVTIRLERLTPDDAKKMLEKSREALIKQPPGYFKNRRPSPIEISERRRQIDSGEFDPWAHFGIRLDRHNIILNGNHTLNALALAESPIDVVVFRNVPRASATIMDTGRRRNNAQALEMAGVNDTAAKTTATKVIYALTTPEFPQKKLGNIRMTNLEVERWYFDNKGMEEYLEYAKRLNREVGINAGVALGILWLGNNTEPDDAATLEFVEGVCQARGLSASDPRARLAARYAQLRQSGRRGGGGARMRESIIEFVKCWNSFIMGVPMYRLTVGAESGPEDVLQAGAYSH